MSTNLKKSKYFIYMLLENNLNLNKHLLSEVGRKHLKSLAEIFYNVFRLPLLPKTRDKFNKKIKILKKFIQSPGSRAKVASKNYKVITELLQLIHRYIKIILK